MITRFTRSVLLVIHYYFRGAKFVSHELIHFCQGDFQKKNFCTIDQNADYLLLKIMTYLFYGIKKGKREREEINFHTQKKYNWQMQREDLMFSQYIVWYEKMMLAPWQKSYKVDFRQHLLHFRVYLSKFFENTLAQARQQIGLIHDILSNLDPRTSIFCQHRLPSTNNNGVIPSNQTQTLTINQRWLLYTP